MAERGINVPKDTFTVAGDAVVLVAKQQDPTIINPDFMKNKEIVPDEWEHTTSFATPIFAQIVYQNGLSVAVEQNRCIIEKKRGNPSKAEHQVYECARKYAEKLEYNYVSFGMNWHVAFVHNKPGIWLKERFLMPGKWQHRLNLATIAFSIPGPDSATCHISLHTLPVGQQPPQMNMGQPPILLGYNLDFQLQNIPEKANRISSILQNFEKYESFMRKKLNKYFEKDLT